MMVALKKATMKEAGTPRIIDATNWRLDPQVGSSQDHFHFVLSAWPSSLQTQGHC